MTKTKQYYECHITMRGDPEFIRPLVESSVTGWKFSAIDGDPVLGNGVLCYATSHFPVRLSQDVVVEKMNFVAHCLSQQGAEVIRQKVELVVYDTKHKAA